MQNKARKVMLLVDKNRWAVWSKDGKDMLHEVKYIDTVELRIGKGEVRRMHAACTRSLSHLSGGDCLAA